jgi:hypothetical protein
MSIARSWIDRCLLGAGVLDLSISDGAIECRSRNAVRTKDGTPVLIQRGEIPGLRSETWDTGLQMTVSSRWRRLRLVRILAVDWGDRPGSG